MSEPILKNTYIFGDPEVDRYRLEIQAQLLEGYVRRNAHRYGGEQVSSILDLGCADGRLSLVLKELYPNARLVGIDKDAEAIARARLTVAVKGLTDCEFVVGDVSLTVPQGQFDLIYASLILLHVANPHHVLEMAVSQLTPSGHIWIKELNPAIFVDQGVSTFAGGSYVKLLRLLAAAMASIGGDEQLATKLPGWLTELGLVEIRSEDESYPLGGPSEEGQAMLGNSLAAIYNARKYIIRATDTTEAELERLLDEVTAAWLRGDEMMRPVGINIIACKVLA